MTSLIVLLGSTSSPRSVSELVWVVSGFDLAGERRARSALATVIWCDTAGCHASSLAGCEAVVFV